MIARGHYAVYGCDVLTSYLQEIFVDGVTCLKRHDNWQGESNENDATPSKATLSYLGS